jgi:hypothetical protein
MKSSSHTIVGIHVRDRRKRVPGVQALLTKYGCHIRTRLGLHEASETVCDPAGLILLEMTGDKKTLDAFVKEVSALDGVDVKKMAFPH